MKQKIKKLKKGLFKIPRIVANHAFFACLVLLLLSLSIGFMVFYKCNILIQETSLDKLEDFNMLNYQKYNEVLGQWKENEERFNLVDFKEYLNPFVLREELTEGKI